MADEKSIVKMNKMIHKKTGASILVVRVSCMKQTTLTQSGAPGRVIGWTNFSH